MALDTERTREVSFIVVTGAAIIQSFQRLVDLAQVAGRQLRRGIAGSDAQYQYRADQDAGHQ
jgi:hypothetical protein